MLAPRLSLQYILFLGRLWGWDGGRDVEGEEGGRSLSLFLKPLTRLVLASCLERARNEAFFEVGPWNLMGYDAGMSKNGAQGKRGL